MADPSYLDYEEDPDLNGVGQPSKTRFAEGWKGYLVNDAMRWLAAAFRRLGDRTLFAPGTADAPAGQLAGSMAMQNVDAVAITGGSISAFGIPPIGSVQQLIMSWANFTLVYDSLIEPFGWVYCDGRTVTIPTSGASYTAPNLLGRYFMALDNPDLVGTGGGLLGSISKTTEPGGDHNHGGVTGETALSVAQLPPHSHPYTRTTGSAGTSGGGGLGNGATASTGDAGSGQGHLHSIGLSGAHTHVVGDIRPPSVMVIPVIRAW